MVKSQPPIIISTGQNDLQILMPLKISHILYNQPLKHASFSVYFSIFLSLSLLLPTVSNAYNSINVVPTQWTARGKNPENNNIKISHLFHVVFICWHWSRAYVGLTLFIRVKCVCRRKKEMKILWNQAIKNSKDCQLCVAPFSFSVEHLTFLLA